MISLYSSNYLQESTLYPAKSTGKIALSTSSYAMNEAVRPRGLLPSLLVIVVMPKLPTSPSQDFSHHKERMRSTRATRDEYDRSVFKPLLQHGVRSIPPPASDHVYFPDNYAYVCLDWLKYLTGPHFIALFHSICFRLHVGDCTDPTAFDFAQSRPAPVQRHISYDEQLCQVEAISTSVPLSETL